ncbi:4'-phosphopantetheinyl transferase family protein [Luteolibacter soli]|uniref:4'-phosphopantetheinyl transferase family protein n=1 Tax=Luteolibacter soli TaxID=3135280 RepID=UPI00311A8933
MIVDPAQVGTEVTACLSAEEQKQAERFRFEKDAVHWRACRAALRTVLGKALEIPAGQLVFEFGEFGKPSLSGHDLHFNLSHCRNLALIALCRDGAVGVDVEPADRMKSLLGCEDAFCHPEELEGLPKSDGIRSILLMRYWTAKEALLKALGTGMSLPPQSVSIAGFIKRGFSDDPRFAGILAHCLDHRALDDHVAWLAVPDTVRCLEFHEGIV